MANDKSGNVEKVVELLEDGNAAEKVELLEETIEQCIIRLPLSYHFLIPQIAKKLEKLTKRIFQERFRHNIKEPLLHVGIDSSRGLGGVDWFAIVQKWSSEEYVLRPISFPVIPVERSTWVGAKNRAFSLSSIIPTVEVFSVECGSYIKSDVLQTEAIHHNPATAVWNDRLYLFGGDHFEGTAHFLEVYNVTENTWQSIDVAEEYAADIVSSARTATMVLQNLIYLFNRKGDNCLVFDPTSGLMERRDNESVGSILFDSSCVINNEIFTIGSRYMIETYDWTARSWSTLRGLESLPEWNLFTTGLFSFKGNLLVLHQPRSEEIWVTEIKVEKRGAHLWGQVISSNSALVLEKPTKFREIVQVDI